MPLSHNTKLFGVKDAKIYPITSDPVGGATVYGTGIDVPGVKSVSIGGDVTNSMLRGDNTLLDADSVLGAVSGTITFAKKALDIMAAVLGGTVVDSGATPAQIASWALPAPGTRLPTWGMTVVTAAADPVAGDTMFSVYKCVISSFPGSGVAEEDYQTMSVDYVAMPRLSDSKWQGEAIRETTVALAAPV